MDADVTVRTRAGLVEGTAGVHCYRFLGLDYADAPTGPHRFLAPRRLTPFDGVRQATTFGATASQQAPPVVMMPMPIIDGRNCLNLNIYTPQLGGDAHLPVLFWIHGGAYVLGANSNPWYDGSAFARDGVVFVSPNYRLGAEGFLALDDGSTNRGIEDLVAALTWVEENISAFGGDPARVTIGGQSAGGGCCSALLATPSARSLFRAAICMSGAARGLQSREAAAEVTAELTGTLGVPATADALAEVPIEALLKAQEGVLAQPGLPTTVADTADIMTAIPMRFAPVIDGQLIRADELACAAAGQTRSKTLLVGATANEFTLLTLFQSDVTPDLVRASFDAAGVAPEIATRYLAAADPLRLSAVAGQVLTDRVFRLPAMELLDAHHAGGGVGFHYELHWPTTVPALGGQAFHSIDLPFEFDLLDADGVAEVLGESPPQALADRLHSAWVDFVRDGDPGWAAFAPSRVTKVFDAEDSLRTDLLAVERSRWAAAEPLGPTSYRRWR